MPDIYLLIEGKQEGPYTEDQVRQSLAEGLIPSDLPAWHEGLTDWNAIANLLETAPVLAPDSSVVPGPLPELEAKPAPFSRHAIASLILALIGIPLFFNVGLWFFIAAAVESRAAKRSIRKHGYRGSRMATSGLWIGVFGVAGAVGFSILIASR